MKSFYLLSSIGIASLLCTSSLKAEPIIPQGAPGLPSTYADCLSHKGCSEELGGMQCLIKANVAEPWQNLCEDLKACETKHSEDEYGWRECIDDSQGKYQQAINPDAALGIAPFQGQQLPVKTDKSGSYYRLRDGGKGFENAEVGD